MQRPTRQTELVNAVLSNRELKVQSWSAIVSIGAFVPSSMFLLAQQIQKYRGIQADVENYPVLPGDEHRRRVLYPITASPDINQYMATVSMITPVIGLASWMLYTAACANKSYAVRVTRESDGQFRVYPVNDEFAPLPITTRQTLEQPISSPFRTNLCDACTKEDRYYRIMYI